MINKYFDGVVPQLKEPNSSIKALEELTYKTIKSYEKNLDDLKITEGLNNVIDLLNSANKFIEESTPWVLAKEEKVQELANVMSVLTNSIIVCTKLLSPVLVETSEKVFKIFNLTEEQKSYEYNNKFCEFAGNKADKTDALFPRLHIVAETEDINSISK